MVEENIMYQQLQKISREKICSIKFWEENLGKFGQNNLCTTKKFPALTPTNYYQSDCRHLLNFGSQETIEHCEDYSQSF